MNTKLMAMAVSFVLALSICFVFIDTSSDADPDDSNLISSYVGEYWEPTYTDFAPTLYKTDYVNGYEKYAELSTSDGGQSYQLIISDNTYSVTSNGTVSGDSITFTVTDSDDSSTSGKISFPITDTSTGRMGVTINGTTTFCFKEGNISVSGLDFKPSTLYDAITLFHNETDNLDSIGTSGCSIQLKGQTISLPSGTYDLYFDSSKFISGLENTDGSMVIEAAEGADVTINIIKTELQSHGSTSITIRNIDFVADEACRLILNNNDNVAIEGCTFNNVILSSYGNDEISLIGNDILGNGNLIEGNTFAVYVSECSDITIKNNKIHNCLCGINIANDGGSPLPIDADIDSNKIYDLNSSDGDGVGIQISGYLQNASFDLTRNTIEGASPAVKIHDGIKGHETSNVTSTGNTFIGCDGIIVYSANDKGEIVPIEVSSTNDSAYDVDGTPLNVTIESESGVVPPVATVTDPLTEVSDQKPPIVSDDDDYLPPFIPTQPAEDDDTVTIVACAAAAAVAAILAVFLVIDRKG